MTNSPPLPGGYFSPHPEKQTLYIPADVLTALREWGEDYCDRLIQIYYLMLNIQDIVSEHQQAAGESVFIGPAVKAGIVTLLGKINEAKSTPYPAGGEMFNTSVLLSPQTIYKVMRINPLESFSKCLLIAVNVAINSPQIVNKADFLADFMSQNKQAKIALKKIVNQYEIICLPQVNELTKLL